MADGPRYTAPFRRRREGRTDYSKRLKLLRSGEHRAVVRLSNAHARVQIIAYDPAGDRTTTAAYSKQLGECGWDHHCGNIPAAYLTGFLAGKQALAEGIDTVVPDLGVRQREEGSRHYATLQGLRDAGLHINVGEEVLPAEGRVKGEHADAYESDGITDAFQTVKDAIIDEHGE